jgi:hypothetical protein
MQGGAVRSHAYYRCKARTLAPGSPALAEHPTTVSLREDKIADAINGWVGDLFAPDILDETVRALVASQGDPAELAVTRACGVGWPMPRRHSSATRPPLPQVSSRPQWSMRSTRHALSGTPPAHIWFRRPTGRRYSMRPRSTP